MIPVDNIPDELLNGLNKFSDWFFKQDLNELEIVGKDLDADYFCSLDYLKLRQEEGNAGFPDKSKGIDMTSMVGYNLDIFRPKITELDNTIKNFICSRSCALKMYYPESGFIDWHTNENASGYNALFTYSLKGDGAFMYQHPRTKNIVTIPDKQGWNMKVGMYDRHDGLPLWHAAYTKCERLTWGYILDKSGWDMLIDEIGVDCNAMADIYGNESQRPVFKSTAVYN